jgi:hypothetical protein
MTASAIRRDASASRRIHDYGRPPVVNLSELTDEALLDGLQRAAFRYFLDTLNPANGLIADNSRANSPVSIAVVGFALSCYPVAVERGWLARADAVERSLAALRFFRNSNQSCGPAATGYKGFYYHSSTRTPTCASGARSCR